MSNIDMASQMMLEGVTKLGTQRMNMARVKEIRKTIDTANRTIRTDIADKEQTFKVSSLGISKYPSEAQKKKAAKEREAKKLEKAQKAAAEPVCPMCT